MTVLQIQVYGQPAPQGSKRAFVNKHTGRAVVMEQMHDRVKSWRQAVVEATRAHIDDRQPGTPVPGAVYLSVTFRLPRPKSHYRTGRNAHLLRDTAPMFPSGTPDLSKLVRATEDALTDAGAWTDDALVVACDARKVYTGPGTLPGADIHIREM